MRSHYLILLCLALAHGLAAQDPRPLAPAAEEGLHIDCSPAAGFHEGPLRVALSAPGARIHYTLDGSAPTAQSPVYAGALVLEKSTVLRAKAQRGGEWGAELGRSFLIGEPPTRFAVLSIGVAPAVLFDAREGLFVKGPKADTSIAQQGANFWSRAELPVFAELFEPDGRCVHSSQIGFRLFGGFSRVWPQKSFALIARPRYGEKRIRHRIFPQKDIDKFKYLVLRNGGSDWGKAFFRDAFMTSLVADWDLETQAYRPCQVYINGQYWGIYNLREKVNTFFIAAQHEGLHEDSIDLIEHRLTLRKGSTQHYRQLLAFLENSDLSQAGAYAQVQRLMEVENFMDYQIAQMFFDNQDAGGNIKYWRPQQPDGRWRWILYDTDFGFGMNDPLAYRHNSLAFHTEAEGPNWPNPPWSTLILRKLLENAEFRHDFANRFAEHLQGSFAPARVEAHLDSMVAQYADEMPRHLSRWNLPREEWERHIGIMRRFAQERAGHLREHLRAYFEAGADQPVRLSAGAGGSLRLNGHRAVAAGQSYEALYFERIPLRVEALPAAGHVFSHWEAEGQVFGEAASLRALPADLPAGLKAVFAEAEHPLRGLVLINEVCGHGQKAKDWLELYNQSNGEAELSGWALSDGEHSYRFPQGSRLPAGGYLIVAEDPEAFRSAYPGVQPVLGPLGFGLNKTAEALSLNAPNGAIISAMRYAISPRDSSFTLDLLRPHLSTQDPENWAISYGPGTPGEANPAFARSRIREAQKNWGQMGAMLALLLVLYLFWRYRRENRA